MTTWLKQSTAATIKFGPFVDATDGVTAETALTISQADIRLSKNGGDSAQTNNAAGATHDENGYYDIPLDTTDTNTIGTLRVFVNESGALPVWQDFMVLPAIVYDSLFSANGPRPLFGIVDDGTAQAATGTTLQLRAAAAFANDEINGATAHVYSGTGLGQSRVITDYVSVTDTATVDTWTTTPSGTILYTIYATPPGASGAPVPANVTQWLGTAVATPTTGGVPEVDLTHIAGSVVSTSTAQLGVNAVQAGGTAWGSGAITAAAIGSDAFTAAKFAADVGTEFGAAVLAAAAADPIDANVEQINTVPIVGDGSATPFTV